MFLFECVAEHLPVFRQVVGFFLGPVGLVSAADFRDFAGYEFLGERSVEIAVECGPMGESGWYLVTASGSLSPQKAWWKASSQVNV